MSLHTSFPKHRRLMKLAEHYRSRSVEFFYQAHRARDDLEAMQIEVAAFRQLVGMEQALSDCGCEPEAWPLPIQEAHTQANNAREFLADKGWET